MSTCPWLCVLVFAAAEPAAEPAAGAGAGLERDWHFHHGRS